MSQEILDETFLRKIPKIELHRHLDGSVRFSTIKEIYQNQDLGIKFKSDDELLKACKVINPMNSLTEVLNCFWTTQKVMHDYSSIKRIAYENVEDLYYDGVVLGELRFAPTFIGHGKSLGYEEIIKGVVDGVLQASKTYKIPIGLIFIAPRSLPLDENYKALIEFVRLKNSHKDFSQICVGFDLAAEESESLIESHQELVDMGRVNGLQLTIHSGEDTSAQLMEKTIKLYQPARIGHGIRCIESAKLMNLIKDNGIHLEVCPTSNYLTKSVDKLEEHPLKQIYDFGISCSLNSDDPHLMGIDLVNEYKVANYYYQFSEKDFKKMNQFALEASFIKKEIKEKIKI